MFAQAGRLLGCNGAVTSVEAGNLCKQMEGFATGARPERQTEIRTGFGLSGWTAKPAPKGEFLRNMGTFRTARSFFLGLGLNRKGKSWFLRESKKGPGPEKGYFHSLGSVLQVLRASTEREGGKFFGTRKSKNLSRRGRTL
jgi:hypothetical protein